MREKRELFVAAEFRAAGDGNSRTLEGHAAVFNQVIDYGPWRELIRPGAFEKTIQERDQVALWDHDSGRPLGRRSKGTLELSEDGTGLRSVLHLPNNSFGNDAYEAVKRGDVVGMSFAFDIIKEVVTDGDGETKPLRELVELRLWEVSPVTFPAYPQTDIEARGMFYEVASGQQDPPTPLSRGDGKKDSRGDGKGDSRGEESQESGEEPAGDSGDETPRDDAENRGNDTGEPDGVHSPAVFDRERRLRNLELRARLIA